MERDLPVKPEVDTKLLEALTAGGKMSSIVCYQYLFSILYSQLSLN